MIQCAWEEYLDPGYSKEQHRVQKTTYLHQTALNVDITEDDKIKLFI
jgi:hypothetical protein